MNVARSGLPRQHLGDLGGIGPLAGGLIVQHLSWAWIFWINVPVGLVAAGAFRLFLHEGVRQERKTLDIPAPRSSPGPSRC